MKNIMKNVIVAAAIALCFVSALNNSIVRVGENANVIYLEGQEIAQKAIEMNQGYHVVEIVEQSADSITYIAEDNAGNQFIIAYAEDVYGNPISSIRVWKAEK